MMTRLFILSFVLLSQLSVAAENHNETEKQLKLTIEKLLPNAKVKSVAESVIPSVYEAVIGAEVLYIDKSGRYAIVGDMLDLAEGQTNLTAQKKNSIRKDILAGLKPHTLITYKPKGETKHTLYVFTDVDCGYCRKLHNEYVVDKDKNGDRAIDKHGIELRYLAFPRAGENSHTYNKMATVWCAKDPAKAMTDAKQGGNTIDIPKDCSHPINEHMDLVRAFSLTGTPAIILDDGTLIAGYVPVEQLAAELNK